MANVFDQVQTPAPSRPVPGSGGWAHPERVWGYAGFWWRVLAWLIDSTILSAATMLFQAAAGGSPLDMIRTNPSTGHLFNVSYITGGVLPADSMPADGAQIAQAWPLHAPGWPGLLTLLLPIAYFALLESSRWQATIGKRICGLRVTRLDGRRISLPRAVGRYLGKFVSALILGIGFLMIAWTRRKQALHDLMADTLVVRLRPPSDLVRFNPPS